MVHVRVGRDDGLTSRQRKIELTNQFDNVVDDFFVADIDQNPLIGVVHQVDVASKNFAGLEVQFDDTRKDGFSV